MLTVVAAFLSPLFSRWRHSAFFALLLLLSLQVVYGWGPMFWVTSHTPGVAAFNNWRVIVDACFSLAVLAGLGITAVQERAARGDSQGDRGGGSSCLPRPPPAAPRCGSCRIRCCSCRIYAPYAPGAIVAAAALTALSMLLLCPPVARRLGARAVGVVAVALLALDIGTFGYGHVPFAPPDEVFPEPPIYRHLKRLDPGVYRIVNIDNTMPKNVESMPFGMYSPTGYDYVLRRALRVLTPLSVNVLNPDFQPDAVVEDSSRLLDLLNVKYVLANRILPGAKHARRLDPTAFGTSW